MPVPNRLLSFARRPSPGPALAPLMIAAMIAGPSLAAFGGGALAQTPSIPAPAAPGAPPPSAPATPPAAGPTAPAPLAPQVEAPAPPPAQGDAAPTLPGPAQGAPDAAPAASPVAPVPQPGPRPIPQPVPAPGTGTPAGTGPTSASPATPDAATPDASTSAPGAEIEELAVDPATLPHDLSPIGMFRAADVVVKAVMIGLAFASLVTWTIFIAKVLEFAAAMRALRRGLRAVLWADTLMEAADTLEGRRDPVALMAQGALMEAERSEPTLDHGGAAGLKDRVASLLGRAEAAGVRRLNRGTGLLATIGSTAPFVGLFGTVWGIMNSFIGISEAQTTNLAVVAPGIAEALLATAIGLVAAIPAVVIYNLFARSLGLYRAGLGDAAAAVERLVSRDLDFREVPAAGRRG